MKLSSSFRLLPLFVATAIHSHNTLAIAATNPDTSRTNGLRLRGARYFEKTTYKIDLDEERSLQTALTTQKSGDFDKLDGIQVKTGGTDGTGKSGDTGGGLGGTPRLDSVDGGTAKTGGTGSTGNSGDKKSGLGGAPRLDSVDRSTAKTGRTDGTGNSGDTKGGLGGAPRLDSIDRSTGKSGGTGSTGKSGDTGGGLKSSPDLDGIRVHIGKTGKSTDIGDGGEPEPAPKEDNPQNDDPEEKRNDDPEEEEDDEFGWFTNEDIDDDLHPDDGGKIVQLHVVPAKRPFHGAPTVPENTDNDNDKAQFENNWVEDFADPSRANAPEMDFSQCTKGLMHVQKVDEDTGELSLDYYLNPATGHCVVIFKACPSIFPADHIDYSECAEGCLLPGAPNPC